jgi:hypothetical protein
MLVYLITKILTNTIIPSITASLIFCFSYTFWQQATFAGQYLPNVTFALLLILLLIRWQEEISRRRFNCLYLFSFFAGLSLAHHRQTLFLAPGSLFFILCVLYKFRERRAKSLLSALQIKPSALLKMLLLFLIPLSIYIYLPTVALRNPPVMWGDPKTFTGFCELIVGERYGFLFVDLSIKEAFIKAVHQVKNLFPSQFTLHPLIFILPGLIICYKKRALSFLLLATVFLVDIGISVHYMHPSIELYYMIPFAIASVWMGLGIWCVTKLISKVKLSLLALSFLLLPLLPAKINFEKNDRSRYYFTYDYTLNILRPLREGAIVILTGGDPHTFNTWYFHYAENVREDVVLIEPHNFHLEWYAKAFSERHPDVRFELYPVKKRFLGYDEVRWQRIEDIVEKNISKRPIYIFPEPNILTEYEFVPEGIFSKVVDKRVSAKELFDILNENRMGMVRHRGIIRKISQIDHSAKVFIINLSVSYFNRARLYFGIKSYREAESEVKKALMINPDYSYAHHLLDLIQKKM